MLEYSLSDALSVAGSNKGARWPKRGAENRLEPDCWPQINPRFSLKAGCSVFTIGSCFARNVELHLERLGFAVPTRVFMAANAELMKMQGGEVLNRYTPPSIYQELMWTKRIMDRDGSVTIEDLEPFLLPLQNDRFIDLQRRVNDRFGISREQAFEHRCLFFELFRQAFECDAIVITLGLIECWWDRKTQSYVEFSNEFRRHAEDDRFSFRQLDFPTAYDFIKKTIDLLSPNGERPILLTTSPIPIHRTFTRDDVIVANTYSKSVLRAVAGQLSAERDFVDYFPSYESVMLSRGATVWEDDLIHVEPAFVGRIMTRVTESYVPGSGTDALSKADEIFAFINRVRGGSVEEASKVLARIGEPDLQSTPPEFPASLARHCIGIGEREKARKAAMVALGRANECGDREAETLLGCATVLEQLGEGDAAGKIREDAFASVRSRQTLLRGLLADLRSSRQNAEASWLECRILADADAGSDILDVIARRRWCDGDFAGAAGIARRLTAKEPNDPEPKLLLAMSLLKAGSSKEANELFCKLAAENTGDVRPKRYVAAHLMRSQRWAEAEAMAQEILAIDPVDTRAASMLERCRRGARGNQSFSQK